MNLSPEEETNAKARVTQLSNEQLQAQADAPSWVVTGRGNYNVEQGQRGADTVARKSAELNNYVNGLQSRSSKSAVVDRKQRLREAMRDAIQDGRSEFVFEGKRFVRKGKSFVSSDSKQTPEDDVNPPSASLRGESRVRTAAGSEVDTRYKLVEASDLITSHGTSYAPSPNYPAELQPRQRDRASSVRQIENILSGLDPSMLGESRMASEGAPIVGADNVVESGNGRSIALKAMYERGGATREIRNKYMRYIHDNAAQFGINPADVGKLKNPILVRERTSEMDRVKFVQEANESNVAVMSSAETGMQDAARLTSGMLSTFDADRDILANRDFLDTFINEVVPESERGAMVDPNGNVSQDGARRVQNALFASAYGDAAALGRMAETADSNIRNVNRAMLQAAPRFSMLEGAIQKGLVAPELSVRDEVTAAASKLAQLRTKGMTVDEFLSQGNLFEEELSPEAKKILRFMDVNKQRANRIAKFLTEYADIAANQSDPNQGTLFDDMPPVSKADLIQQAIKQSVNASKQQDWEFLGNQENSISLGQQYSIEEVLRIMKTNKGNKNASGIWVDYAPVTSESAKRIFDSTGIRIDEQYVHTLDGAGVQHPLTEHGSDTEKQKHQLPLTEADYKLLPEVISNPDKIERGGRTKQGLDSIVYIKRINGHSLVIEEVRTGKRKLVLKTMRKIKPKSAG
jgi:hypothetical protein